MAIWQRPVRIALASFVVAFAGAVLFGIRDRSEPARARIVERDDPDAIIQSRGARIVRAEASTENLRAVARRQLTYPDGAVRLIDGVKISVAELADRGHFTLSGNEATVNGDQNEVHISGDVQFRSGDGLEAATAQASYSESDGVVRMPGNATFARSWMRAFGETARYDRRLDLLRLERGARVELLDGDRTTLITSMAATMAQTDSYMRFEGGVTVTTGGRLMEAEQAQVALVGNTARFKTLELWGHARIVGSVRETGQFREMTAPNINFHYGSEVLERVSLVGGAVVDLFAEGGAPGARIVAQTIEVVLAPDGVGLTGLVAREAVVVELPSDGTAPAQRIRAEAFNAAGAPGGRLTDARFDGAVEYRERSQGGAADSTSTRITRAERLEATLTEGLAALEAARFLGGVTFKDEEVTGEADEASYVVADGTLELVTTGPAGKTPRLIDRRGSVQAETIVLTLEGHEIEAVGDVESVLAPLPEAEPASQTNGGELRRPGVLVAGQPIYVTAGRLSYDAERSVVIYSETARLWQAETEFRGETIVLDEASGNISAEGDVWTRSTIIQTNDETGEAEGSVTNGRGASFHYDNALRRATYSTDAEVEASPGDLKADTVAVILMEDARSLDRLEAVGDVTLDLPGRRVSGANLIYYDADGRYEMDGEPVRIVEETENECRETTGRTLTFFVIAEAVSVDGQSEVRTETSRGTCAKPMF